MILHVQGPNSDQVWTKDYFQIKFKLQDQKHIFFQFLQEASA